MHRFFLSAWSFALAWSFAGPGSSDRAETKERPAAIRMATPSLDHHPLPHGNETTTTNTLA